MYAIIKSSIDTRVAVGVFMTPSQWIGMSRNQTTEYLKSLGTILKISEYKEDVYHFGINYDMIRIISLINVNNSLVEKDYDDYSVKMFDDYDSALLYYELTKKGGL